MKNQFIRVNTKKGLLAGFECAKDFPGTTEITLVRKSNETIYKLYPNKYSGLKGFNEYIQKAKGKIKQTKACYLLE
jgi:hypothetical protein